MLKFKVIKIAEVVEHLEREVNKDKSKTDNIVLISKMIIKNEWRVVFAFKNQFEQMYLAIEDKKQKIVWFGDVSNWQGADSEPENDFVRKTSLLLRDGIIKPLD